MSYNKCDLVCYFPNKLFIQLKQGCSCNMTKIDKTKLQNEGIIKLDIKDINHA